MTRVALVIAVREPGRDLSQVALPDWLTAKYTERLRARRPAIHQDKFHLPPPSHLHSSSKTKLRVPPSSQADVLRAQEIALRGLRSLARGCLDFFLVLEHREHRAGATTAGMILHHARPYPASGCRTRRLAARPRKSL